jgi:FtsP/CotA-like multicopper oxidase with cupredoxin domain
MLSCALTGRVAASAKSWWNWRPAGTREPARARRPIAPHDTVNVPYYNGRGLAYPSVRIRMDFRDPNTVGTFVYHCHLLEHEDNGMMGLIRVEPAETKKNAKANSYDRKSVVAVKLCGAPRPH